MKIFDMHTHCFPDALAPKALPRLAEICKSPYFGTGTYDDLCEKMLAAGCSGAMLLHIATKPTQMTSVNNFAAACQKGNFYCFGSVFPTAENAVEELHRIKALGLKGVKLHPDYQGFFVDDPAVFPVYQTAAELRLPITFHAGYDPYSPDVVHCPPKALAEIADRFPELTIIAAHMGGMRMDAEVEKHLVGKPNVYFDTAYATYSMDAARCGELIRRHGVDKVFFATDFPWSAVETELSQLRQCGFTEGELEQIGSKNMERVFGVTLQ
ncbi:MAG: amidohydrolase [Clostridia bacterium]|nr:amidohydrolase [Clostridia bacterium]